MEFTFSFNRILSISTKRIAVYYKTCYTKNRDNYIGLKGKIKFVIVADEGIWKGGKIMLFERQNSRQKVDKIIHSGQKEKEAIIEYMLYYGIAIVEVPAGQGMKFYMIKQVNDQFSIYKLQELTGYNIQHAHGYINLKGENKSYYKTKEEAFSSLKQIHDLMEANPLETDF